MCGASLRVKRKISKTDHIGPGIYKNVIVYGIKKAFHINGH